ALTTPLGVLYRGDAATVMDQLPPGSVDCIMGSPPYFAVRDYDVKGQIGIEESIDDYLDRLCGAYDSAKRVLKTTGSCWVVIGDLYIQKDLVLLPSRFALEMKRR